MSDAEDFSRRNIPERSTQYKEKEIATEGFVAVRGKVFYKRVFTDGYGELARTDAKTGMTVHLCFPAAQRPEQISLIKEAIKHNFNPGLLRSAK